MTRMATLRGDDTGDQALQFYEMAQAVIDAKLIISWLFHLKRALGYDSAGADSLPAGWGLGMVLGQCDCRML